MFAVFDLDGTLARNTPRNRHIPQDYDLYHADGLTTMPLRTIVSTAHALQAAGHRVEVWTGRPDKYYRGTTKWLTGIGLFCPLRMRPGGDESSMEFKIRMCEAFGYPNLVFDDRPECVEVWRTHGIDACLVHCE